MKTCKLSALGSMALKSHKVELHGFKCPTRNLPITPTHSKRPLKGLFSKLILPLRSVVVPKGSVAGQLLICSAIDSVTAHSIAAHSGLRAGDSGPAAHRVQNPNSQRAAHQHPSILKEITNVNVHNTELTFRQTSAYESVGPVAAPPPKA